MPRETKSGVETGMCPHGNAWGKPDDPCTREPEAGQETVAAKERQMSELLTSKETTETIQLFPDVYRDALVGLALQYVTMDPDQKRLRRYLESLRPFAKWPSELIADFRTAGVRAKAYIGVACKNLGLKPPLGVDGEEIVFQWITKKFIHEGYLYHGFNGVFEDSIQQTGLDAETRAWDWSDVGAVREIFERVGEPLQLVHTKINSIGKLSIGDYPENVYPYAVSSPEWFGNFLITGSPSLELDQTAFFRRDYEAARENLEKICDVLIGRDESAIRQQKSYPNLSEDERKTIFEFFERYWKLFAAEKAKPKVALIKRTALEGRTWVAADTFAKWKQVMGSGRYALEVVSLANAIELVMHPSEINSQVTHAIPQKDMLIVSLPAYDDIHPVTDV